MWVAGIAVIVFSLTGIAAIMGWIPTSMGRAGEEGVLSTPAKPATSGNSSATAKTPVARAPVAATPERTAAAPVPAPVRCAECGVVESTRAIAVKGEGSGLGAVGGAVVGGLLGNQVGSGRGNTAATAIGAVGGAMAGNEVEKRVKTNTAYEVTVRLDDGSSRVITSSTAPQWRNGDRVKIVGGVIQANP
jgi:outer membrane lipoprotein SlyB